MDYVGQCGDLFGYDSLALQIQRRMDKTRAQRDRQIGVYRVLMIERLSLSPRSIAAFNAVPIEFYGEESVMLPWRKYLEHMGTEGGPRWAEERLDMFFDLMLKMSEKLGYKADYVALKREFYWPKGHDAVNADEGAIRYGLAQILTGKAKFPFDVQSFPGDPELNKLLKAWLKKTWAMTTTFLNSGDGAIYSENSKAVARLGILREMGRTLCPRPNRGCGGRMVERFGAFHRRAIDRCRIFDALGLLGLQGDYSLRGRH